MSEPAAANDVPDAEKPTSRRTSAEDSESDDSNYIVEKITNVRHVKNKLEFETHWQGDTRFTWEPLSSFPKKLEHEEIVKFKDNFPEKYKIVENFIALKNKKKTHRNWSYVELKEEEEKNLYEKQDSLAPRELKSLYDPNRLKDNQEEYLKAFDPGVRISRNAIRQLKEGRGISADSKSSGASTPVPKERKKRGTGGGRKKKTTDEATTSTAAVKKPPQKRKGRKPAKAKSPTPMEDDDDDVFATPPVSRITGSLAEGIDNWTPIRRAVKLNSSDSDSDDEEKRPPPKKKAVVQKPRPAKSPDSRPSSSLSYEPPKKQKAVASQPTVRRVSTEEKRPSPTIVPQKRPIREEVGEQSHELERIASPVVQNSIRDPDIYYAGVDNYSECEADVARYGLEVFRGDVSQHFERQTSRLTEQCKHSQLADAIKAMDIVATECLLETLKRNDIMTILTTGGAPLHEMLACSAGKPETDELCERMVRLVLHYVPIEYLKAVDGANNNLVNRAIITKNVSLVRFLVNIGSPLDMKNINRMSAVENALLVKKPNILEIVLNKGGTFHYMMDEFEPCYPYLRDRNYLNSNAVARPLREQIKGVARVVYDSLDGLCSRQRTALLPKNIIAHSQNAGPIVCCPRGKLMTHGFKHTIRFRFPVSEHFENKGCQYMLSIIPVKFDHQEEKFVSKQTGVRMVENPKLNGHDCLSLVPQKKFLPYYNCTVGFHAQAQNPTIWSQNDNTPDQFSSNDFKSVFQLELHIDPNEKLDFLACQVIRIDYTPSHNQSASFDQTTSHNSNFRRGNSNGPNNQYPRNNNQQRQGLSYNQPGPSVRAPFYQNQRYQNNRPGGGPYNSNQHPHHRQQFNRPGSSNPGPSSSPFPPPSPRY